ncbi:ATP-binding protein [Rhodopirellula sp. MGV]|uniref:ATP-binding protein n=1 Tax=Rhodopirellula sp. MGV TaxID=2023130 RepID=UPI000B97AB4E|nr:PAS domain-containing sensor histidine kinase [Rhodopirellula sp. MGV]OYP33178.1 hypothetical protein CGZ80_18330 [Rhodopirellula sp. MGV]PNY35090.1 PAS domain S-box protein [Rhodopirellula baltica]
MRKSNESKVSATIAKSKAPDGSVRNLAWFGIIAAGAIVGILIWSMLQIQNDRNARDEIAEAVAASIASANDQLTRSVHYTTPLFQGDLIAEKPPTERWEFLDLPEDMRTTATTQMGETAKDLAEKIAGLEDLNRRCYHFAQRLQVAEQERLACSKSTRSAIGALHASLDVAVGEEALRQAIQLRDYRNLDGDDKEKAAVEFVKTFRPVYHLGAETDEVVELESLCDRLLVTTDRDLLTDLKDNYISGCLLRLEREITAGTPVGPLEEYRNLLSNVMNNLLGEGFRRHSTYQTIEPGHGGFFNACENWLLLQEELNQLEQLRYARIDEFVEARNQLFTNLAEFSNGSGTVASRAIRQAMYLILVFGVIFGLVFTGLARKISDTIVTQFTALEHQAVELEAASLELKSSSEHLSLLSLVAKHTDNAVAITNAEGIIEWVNEAFERMTGYTHEEVAGSHWFDRLERSGVDAEMAEEFHEAFASQRGIDCELSVANREGDLYWVALEMRPILHETGGARYIWIERDISGKIAAQRVAETLNSELRMAERYAGMAEVATGVLHNVGNVLNSVNVSANVLRDSIGSSELASLQKIAALLSEHQSDLSEFLSDTGRRDAVVQFVGRVSTQLATDQDEQLKEVDQLFESIEHIKAIVASQQSFARLGGGTESLNPTDLIENAILLHSASLTRHGVEVVKKFSAAPCIFASKHDVLQILVNLIKNAQQASNGDDHEAKSIEIDIHQEGPNVKISVKDYGCGIEESNLMKIFQHGFTTKDEGHGFGLHSCALAASNMGGKLEVESEGLGKGAKFTLTLPTTESIENAGREAPQEALV